MMDRLSGWVGAGVLAFGLSAGAFEGPPGPTGATPTLRTDPPPIPAHVLERRREALLERVGSGIVVLRSGEPADLDDHPQASDFRQDNGFYYLTGLETPGSWLVLFARTGTPDSAALFVPARDAREEAWTGRRPGPGSEVVARTGIAAVHPSEEFERLVVDRLGAEGPFAGYGQLHTALDPGAADARDLLDAAAAGGLELSELGPIMADLRLVKDSVEIARLRRAASITAAGLREAMRSARPDMYEYQLEAVIEFVFRWEGAQRLGFPSIVGSGPNSVVLHYDDNRRRMEAGELVVMDVGAEYGYYTADITRTIPVNGRFTDRQRAIYELVLRAQSAAIDAIEPGVTVFELTRIARAYLREHSAGLCGGRGCDRRFVHGLSHWLGMDVHDVGSYATSLAPGMVLTVEPGVYLPDEDLGVRIEDDVLVTPGGPEILSDAVPRTVDEIEALMATAPELSPTR